MKIDLNSSEVIKLGASTTEKAFSFDENSSFLVDALINLYEKPIESIVREICSNAYDATVENKNLNQELYPDKFVVYLDKQKFIVQDFGAGMSPEFFRDYYTKIGFSTKRDNSEQIGGFGLGRLSVLSLVESFKVITVYEGVRYEYLVFRDNGVRTEILGETPVTDEVGTRIEVIFETFSNTDTEFLSEQYIKNYRSLNFEKFYRALESQLVFFTGFKCYVNSVNLDVSSDKKETVPFSYLSKTFKLDPVSKEIFDLDDVTILMSLGYTVEKFEEDRIKVCLGKVLYKMHAGDIYSKIQQYVSEAINKRNKDSDKIFLWPKNWPVVYIPLSSGLKPTPSRESLLINDSNVDIIARYYAAYAITLADEMSIIDNLSNTERVRAEVNKEISFNFSNWDVHSNDYTKVEETEKGNVLHYKVKNFVYSSIEDISILLDTNKDLRPKVGVNYSISEFPWLSDYEKKYMLNEAFTYSFYGWNHDNRLKFGTYNEGTIDKYSKNGKKKPFKKFLEKKAKVTKGDFSILLFKPVNETLVGYQGSFPSLLRGKFKSFNDKNPLVDRYREMSTEEFFNSDVWKKMLADPELKEVVDFAKFIDSIQKEKIASLDNLHTFESAVEEYEQIEKERKEKEREERKIALKEKKEQLKKEVDLKKKLSSIYTFSVLHLGGSKSGNFVLTDFSSKNIQYVFYGSAEYKIEVMDYLARFRNKSVYVRLSKQVEKALLKEPTIAPKLINIQNIETMLSNSSNLPRLKNALSCYRAERVLMLSKWNNISDIVRIIAPGLYNRMNAIVQNADKNLTTSIRYYYDEDMVNLINELETVVGPDFYVPSLEGYKGCAEHAEFISFLHDLNIARAANISLTSAVYRGIVKQYWDMHKKMVIIRKLKSGTNALKLVETIGVMGNADTFQKFLNTVSEETETENEEEPSLLTEAEN